MPSRSYLNTVLTVIAVFLGLNLLVQAGNLPAGSSAAVATIAPAQPEGTVAQIPNAAEQRRAMMASLEAMNRRLAAIESKLDKGLSVKVTEMPAVKVTEMPDQRN
jgi:hypothetical protein